MSPQWWICKCVCESLWLWSENCPKLLSNPKWQRGERKILKDTLCNLTVTSCRGWWEMSNIRGTSKTAFFRERLKRRNGIGQKKLNYYEKKKVKEKLNKSRQWMSFVRWWLKNPFDDWNKVDLIIQLCATVAMGECDLSLSHIYPPSHLLWKNHTKYHISLS